MSRVPVSEDEYLDEASVRRIFARMNALGMKRVELSRALGYSNGAYMTRLEKGELRIRKENAPKWANALQTTTEYIFGQTDDPLDASVYLDKKDRQIQKMLLLHENMTESELKLWLKIGQDILNARKG